MVLWRSAFIGDSLVGLHTTPAVVVSWWVRSSCKTPVFPLGPLQSPLWGRGRGVQTHDLVLHKQLVGQTLCHSACGTDTMPLSL